MPENSLGEAGRSRGVTLSRLRHVLVGVALLAVGVYLVSRPLTALVVGTVTLALALGGAGLILARNGGERWWRWPGSLALIASAIVAIVAIVALSDVIRLLPYAAALALLANAGRMLAATMRRNTPGRRIINGMYCLASVLAAGLFWIWPDAGSVVLAAAYGLGLALGGVSLIVRAFVTRRARLAHSVPPLVRGVAVTAALAVTAGATAGTAYLYANTARVDDFYSWSGEIDADAGDVLRVAPYSGETPDGAEAIRVLYVTSYADGAPALASAVIAYPAEPANEPRQVLAWQHGTTGVAQSCGPSVGDGALTEYAIPGISRAIERGWVVIATDYPGQGTAGRYPYLIGEGEGRATLDAIRAVQQIDGAHASNDAWIWGHSQGGHATLWAGQIAQEYAPDVSVLGVAALSAASDPLALAQRITGNSSGALTELVTSLVIVPYAEEYADIDLATAVHPAGQGIVTAFASRCVVEAPTLVSALVGATLVRDAPLYRFDMTTGPIRDRLSQNIAEGVVSSPLFLGQGTDDEVIPIEMQRDLNAALCDAGRTVETHEYPGRSHMGAIEEGSPLIDDLYAWADAVLAGERPANCHA